MRRFTIVLPKSDGGVELYPMKEWLRQNRGHVPAGLDPTASTSQQLRNGLKKRGWVVRETPSEEQLVMPGGNEAVETVLGEQDADSDMAPEEAAFQMEYQLRDFLSQNLPTIAVDGRRLRL